MTRLPTPGGDDGSWGNILNDYLSAAHNTDGTLKTSAVTAAGGEVTSNKGQAGGYAALNSSGQVPVGQLGGGSASGSNFLRGDGTWSVPSGGSATLAGDTDVTIATPADGQILTYDGTATKWKNRINAALQPYIFNVKDYGAKGDGATDDTATINAAVTAATAYATANGSYAEVFFPSGVYQLSGATTKGGSTSGNAQIPLPVVGTGTPKLVLVFRGAVEATAFPHWNQTVSQKSGVVLNSTLTGQTVDGSWGAPSIIGGPTPQGGYGSSSALFNNVQIVISGITVMAPLDPTVIAFDFRGMAQATIINAAALCNATPSQMNSTTPSHSWATGVFMPQNLNNDNSYIGSFSCEGFYYGVAAGEHVSALRIACVYCVVGIFVQADGNGGHGSSITYASIEACQIGIQVFSGSSFPVPFEVGLLDAEAITTAHIQDTDNALGGLIHVHDNANPIIIQGAGNVEIIVPKQPRGHVAAPSVPGSTTPQQNTFWRHAAVTVSGGTVTAIAVDGTATGITSGTVIVPSGKSITLTYSSAPTWNWVLL